MNLVYIDPMTKLKRYFTSYKCGLIEKIVGMVNYYNTNNIKKELGSDIVLMMYDEKLSLIFATGISAIRQMLHQIDNVLSIKNTYKAEHNYIHLDQEATAIFWSSNFYISAKDENL